MTDPVALGALIFLGLVLLAIEGLVVPGFGLPGVLGVLCTGAGCYYFWVAHGPVAGLTAIFGSVLLSGGMLWWMARGSSAKRLILNRGLGGAEVPTPRLNHLVGRDGVVVTPLRPGGMVDFDGERYEALADGGAWLDAQSAVRVLRLSGSTIIVEPSEPIDTES